jgi:hypothetical protein
MASATIAFIMPSSSMSELRGRASLAAIAFNEAISPGKGKR